LRAGWLTDIHLNFLSPDRRSLFYANTQRENLDALLIGGDIGEAGSVTAFLSEFASAVQVPIYLVLGNHDFYGGSIADVRRRVLRQCASHPWLRWLPATGVVCLTDQTALIGHDTWADGRLGDYARSEVLLNDYFLIEELRDLSKVDRLSKLMALGDEGADFLEHQARDALAQRREVLVLTHVPPFRGACWHEGKISGDDYRPHFACQAVGERLAALMRDHPHNKMTVLCGHTHSSGVVQILHNLSVRTGAAEYGYPKLQDVIDVR
jgi:predicted phosphodiesterase